MIEREKERKYAHERANGNDEIARVKITCGGTNSQGPENSELQTQKIIVGEVRERPRWRT